MHNWLLIISYFKINQKEDNPVISFWIWEIDSSSWEFYNLIWSICFWATSFWTFNAWFSFCNSVIIFSCLPISSLNRSLSEISVSFKVYSSYILSFFLNSKKAHKVSNVSSISFFFFSSWGLVTFITHKSQVLSLFTREREQSPQVAFAQIRQWCWRNVVVKFLKQRTQYGCFLYDYFPFIVISMILWRAYME